MMKPTLERLHEALAIDFWESDATNTYEIWDEMPDFLQAQYFANADAILDIIADEGWVLTPRPPAPQKDEWEELRADYYDDIARECNGY